MIQMHPAGIDASIAITHCHPHVALLEESPSLLINMDNRAFSCSGFADLGQSDQQATNTAIRYHLVSESSFQRFPKRPRTEQKVIGSFHSSVLDEHHGIVPSCCEDLAKAGGGNAAWHVAY